MSADRTPTRTNGAFDQWDFEASTPDNTLWLLPPAPIVPLPGIPDGQNLILNGNFEQDIHGAHGAWKTDVGAEAIQQTWRTSALSKSSLQLDGSIPATVSQRVHIRQGGAFVFRAFVLRRNAGDVSIEITGGPWGKALPVVSTKPLNGTAYEWAIQEVVFDMPAAASSLDIVLKSAGQPNAANNDTNVWFSDCQLYALRDRNPANLVANGDFNNGTDVWRIPAESETVGRFEIDSAGVGPFGLNSLSVKVKPTIVQTAVLAFVGPLKESATYELSAYIRTQSLTGDASIDVRHGEKDWQGYIVETEKVSGDSDWTRVSVEFTLPADTVTAKLNLKVRQSDDKAAMTGTAWFDRIEVVPR